MVARVVQFSETRYDKEGMFLEFLVDELRPVIVEKGDIIDIFSHQFFERVPMLDGIIPIDTLAALDRDILYAYTIHEANFPEQYLPTLLGQALSTYKWYYEEYSNPTNAGTSSNIISFERAKQKLIRNNWKTKNDKKGKENQKF